MSRKILNNVLLFLLSTVFSGCLFSANLEPNNTESFAVVNEPTETMLPLSTISPTEKPTLTSQPTQTKQSTITPYDYHNIGFPLPIDDVTEFKKNFNCLTTYGDYSHDGNDIMIMSGKNIPVYAVDNGFIESSVFINSSVGYELHLLLGSNIDDKEVHAIYVHLTQANPVGQFVKKGDIIGYIALPKQDHLHFEIRIGSTPRMESPSDGEPGDEIDVTYILEQFVPPEKIGYDDRYGTTCE